MMNSEMSSASYQTAAAGAHQSSNHAQFHPHGAQRSNHGGAVHHQPATHNQPMMYQQQQQMYQQQQPQLGNGSGMPMGGGGTLYTNLIPGHYRYGAKPPAPPPGPLSYSNTSSSSQSRARQHQLHSTNVRNDPPLEQSYQNIPPARTSPTKSQNSAERNYLQVSEPDDDDEFFDVVSLDLEDDEKYYRPFKHAGNGGDSPNGVKKKAAQKKGKSKGRNGQTTVEEAKPVDLLSVLLGDSALQQLNHDSEDGMSDMAILMGEASSQSQKARAMTDALAAKQHKGGNAEEGDNDLYVATSNAHAEAAVSFQKVYRMLLGLESKDVNGNGNSVVRQKAAGDALSPSEELAKSMLILANAHARMAKSLGSMGEKWNMGKVDAGGRMIPKNAEATTGAAKSDANVRSKGTENNASKAKANGSTPTKDGSPDTATSSPEALQHERLRMAVRGALDTANHEEDITNSTFLARSTLSASKNSKQGLKAKSTKNKLAGMMGSKRKNVEQGVNPVDDLMKLERELQSMDMALEMENSVASLGTATTATRPDGSFMVVPKGSSYLSSSSMWSHQQHTKPPQHGRHQQKGAAGVRSRANHLQNFATKTGTSAPSPPRQKQGLQITPGNPGALDQSWWGGGQGSILANAAANATSNSQRPPPNSADPNNPNATSSTGTKQFMQLMDSLKRLGDENAHLMREVEDAKAAKAEAKAAQEMVAKFKKEYAQRFNKVKEALGKYSSPNADNPVAKSAYMKSVSATEIKKRDEMIKQLSADLKKERDECKRKDSALNKYEAFYREVKARSAEKAKQRAEQERQKAEAEQKQKLDQQRLEQQRRLQQQKLQQQGPGK